MASVHVRQLQNWACPPTLTPDAVIWFAGEPLPSRGRQAEILQSGGWIVVYTANAKVLFLQSPFFKTTEFIKK